MNSGDEILDIFDEQQQWIGTAARSEVHELGHWHKTAQVWVINSNRELLLQLRSQEKDCFPNLWDISSAGHIPAGQNPLESAVRELEEELGVKCRQQDLYLLFNHAEPFEDPHLGHIDREFSSVFLIEVANDIHLTLQKSEVAAVRWISYKELIDEYHRCTEEFVPHLEHFTRLVAELDVFFLAKES